MKIEVFKTRAFIPPQDDILSEMLKVLPKQLPEKCVVIVTSKVVSIWEGRCEKVSDFQSKDELIKREAQMWLPREEVPGKHTMHTIYNDNVIGSAGVDASNGGDYYILLPKDADISAKKIREFIKENYKIKDVGVIITDSRSMPFRRGSIGYGIGFAGLFPIKDYRGKPDIFGRELKVSISNVIDSIACSAVLNMGEGKECTPFALVTELPESIEFCDEYKEENPDLQFKIKLEDDIYYPFFGKANWQK